MDERERLQSLLFSAYANAQSQNNQNNVNVINNPITPQQAQPLIPPTLTAMELLSENIGDYRASKHFDGEKAYRFAVIQRIQALGRELPPFYEISSMASNLWTSEQHNIKQVYVNIAGEAEHIYKDHNARFPEQKCEGCTGSHH